MDVPTPRAFALHRMTSLALFVPGFGLFAFVPIAGRMIEGETLRFDTEPLSAPGIGLKNIKKQ